MDRKFASPCPRGLILATSWSEFFSFLKIELLHRIQEKAGIGCIRNLAEGSILAIQGNIKRNN